MRIVIFFLFCICLFGLGCSSGKGSAGHQENTKVSEVMSVSDFDLDDYKGKVVLINFWATWCGPCKMEVPHMLKLHQNFDPKEVSIVGVSIDNRGPNETVAIQVKRFVEYYKLSYMIVHDREAELARAFGGIRAVPTSILINSKGVIQKTYIGVRDYADFAHDIEALLDQS